AVAAVAAVLDKQPLSHLGHRAGSLPVTEPGLILRRIHYRDRPGHRTVQRAAELGAEEMVCADLRRGEPEVGIRPGDYILVQAERWDEEAVDHILGGHREQDWAADGNVQLVHLPTAFGVLYLPHPLLADH